MVVVEGDVVEAQTVQPRPGELVSQEGGVAFDVCIQALLGDEVGGDALNFVRGQPWRVDSVMEFETTGEMERTKPSLTF